MDTRSSSTRLTPEVSDLLGRLAERLGVSKTAVIVSGILALAEVHGLIPSAGEALLRMEHLPERELAPRRPPRPAGKASGRPIPAHRPDDRGRPRRYTPR